MPANPASDVRHLLGEKTSVLAGLVDPKVALQSPQFPIDELSALLETNKLSREFLDELVEEAEGAERDKIHREARVERIEAVTELFNNHDIDCASMKNLETPKSMMSDIDFLFSDPSEEARAARVLTEDGYELIQFRLLAHPLKTMPIKPDDQGRPGMPGDHDRPVDLYPDAIWIRKRVCDPSVVVERANDDGWYSPTPEDDLYLVATHAYSHLSLRFAELYHGVIMLEHSSSFDWDYLLSVAADYGCEDALYVYLRLLDEYLAVTDRQQIPTRVFDSLGARWICRLADRWLNGRELPYDYPVEFPIWLANLTSSIYHTPRIATNSSPRETLKDFQSHFLVAASKIITGET